MRIGIDASNLRRGGGLTHLAELLRAAHPREHGFDQVIVWGGSSKLSLLEERPWLHKRHEPMLDRTLPMRVFWQRNMLDRIAIRLGCNVLFVPGGSYAGTFRPFVTMFRNMLPFERSEARRYGVSWMLLKMILLHQAQTRTFKSADGLIFLNQYAYNVVMETIKQIRNKTTIIAHGVDNRLLHEPRTQASLAKYSLQSPFCILYVSIVDMYKHQWHVAEAVAKLREAGLPVRLDLIGPAYPPALKKLRRVIRIFDPAEVFIRYRGPVPYSELSSCYQQADLFVFASSCENMPNILLEAMAAGLPIACSNRGPMPEVLGNSGLYFNPEKPLEIADAIRTLLVNPVLREQKAWAAYERAKSFSWERCARQTFDFIAHVVKDID